MNLVAADSDLGGISFPIVHPLLRQALPALLEIANLNQRRPEFQRSFDGTDYIVHNPQRGLVDPENPQSPEYTDWA